MSDEAYNATVAMSTTWGSYYLETVKELGEEKALELFGKISAQGGQAMALMLKEQFKDKDFDLKAFSDMFRMGMDSIGVKYTVEETPDKAHFTVTGCPQYDGWTQAGLSHEQIWRLCDKGDSSQFNALMAALPMKAEFSIRSKADLPCTGTFTLKK